MYPVLLMFWATSFAYHNCHTREVVIFSIIEINIVYWKINTLRLSNLLCFGDVGKFSEAMVTFGNIGEFSEDSERWELYINRMQEYFAAN